MEIYHDYLTCQKACRYWARSRSTEAPARSREYAGLATELAEELMPLMWIPPGSAGGPNPEADENRKSVTHQQADDK